MRACLTLLLLLTAGVAARQQARDVTTVPPPGTARLSGRVVTVGEPRPMRRVIVTVTGEGLKDSRSTITDEQGRFGFDGLPAGRFVVTGTKPAYLPGAFGAEPPGREGVAIQLKAGESRTDVVFAMARGAVVTGALHTETGEAATNVEVAAFRVPPPGTNWLLILAASTTTDDRGVYRLFELPPGEYYVVASLRRRLTAPGEAARWTPAQIDAVLQGLRDRSETATVPSLGAFAYAPVYFPGSTSPEGASAIRLKAEEERTAVDFAVPLSRMATIEGVLVGGADVGKAQFFISAVGIQLPSLLGTTPSFSSQTGPNGRTFKYAGVGPGRYTITAHLPSDETTWARTEVTVSGEDVTGVTIALQPAWRMSGRVVFDGKTLAAPASLSAVSLRANPVNGLWQSAAGTTRMGNPLVPPAQVSADGRFEMRGLLSETYRLVATVTGAPGWWLQSVRVNGRDVLDQDFTVAGDVADAVVTFSDQQTELSGRIITDSGPPRRSWFVIVFPADQALWRSQARRVTAARTDTEGRWIVRNLPPGDYLLAVVTDLVAGELSDPAFLRRISPAAIPVTLGEGEKKLQDLRIGSGI